MIKAMHHILTIAEMILARRSAARVSECFVRLSAKTGKESFYCTIEHAFSRLFGVRKKRRLRDSTIECSVSVRFGSSESRPNQ